jgi:NTE family protein
LQAHLAQFPKDFLEVDFQGKLVGDVLSPAGLQRLTSPWHGRGHLLADALDAQLFAGATFGGLTELPGRAYLIVGATDLVNGSEFDFASDQFFSLCSSIDDVPLAFAVAASCAVPLVFSPLTLQNHSLSCPGPGGRAASAEPDAATARARLVQSEAQSLDRSERKYVHLVDGGVSDNLGLRRIADYVVQAGGIRAVLELLSDGGSAGMRIPRRIVFLSVNSETRTAPEFESSAQVPGTLDVLGALINGNLGRHSRETALVFDDAIEQWRTDLRRDGADVDIFRIEVNLYALEDAALRNRVLAIPTAFRISAEDRELLRVAARVALDESVEQRRFLQSVSRDANPAGGR